MFNYAGLGLACDVVFLVFSLVFFYTRLILFPTQ
jgi:ceramide synthetase